MLLSFCQCTAIFPLNISPLKSENNVHVNFNDRGLKAVLVYNSECSVNLSKDVFASFSAS